MPIDRRVFLKLTGASLALAATRVGPVAHASGQAFRCDEPIAAFGPSGLTYVLDRGAHSVRVRDHGHEVAVLRLSGPDTPSAVAVGRDLTWVSGHYRVAAFADDRSEVLSLPSTLQGPRDVCATDDDHVWVADFLAHRIEVFDRRGRHVHGFGTPGAGEGELNGPRSLAVQGDLVYVANFGNGGVDVFDTEGRHQGVFTTGGHPTWVRLDGSGQLWVADRRASTVRGFSQGGELICEHQIPAERGSLRSLALAPDGTRVAGVERPPRTA